MPKPVKWKGRRAARASPLEPPKPDKHLLQSDPLAYHRLYLRWWRWYHFTQHGEPILATGKQ